MKRRWAAAVAVVVALLSGCTSQARTDVTVTSPSSAEIVVSAHFSDEAAEVLTKGSDARLELLDVFKERTGQEPQVQDRDGELVLSARIDYDALATVGDVVGVKGLSLSGAAEDATATIALRDAGALVSAIEAGIAQEQDAVALRAAMVKSTTLVLTVRYPGGVIGSPDVSSIAGVTSSDLSGSTFTLVRSLDEATDGTLVVRGDTTRDVNFFLLGFGFGLLLVCGAVVLFRRRSS